MDSCDVLIVGGGPAGSTCGWRLAQAGLDVLIADQASFPRDKPCAGWITPPVFDRLELAPSEYAAGHMLEPIRGFVTGVVGGPRVETECGRTVSYAIRRSEFDAYLLRRSGARLRLGYRAEDLRRTGGDWVVNGEIRARALVGAGGHFCPVARAVNGAPRLETPVRARVIEFPLSPGQQAACRVDPGMPEIYFDRDLDGYGWLVRKGHVLNVGFGRIGAGGLTAHVTAFVEHAETLGRLPPGTPAGWQGHAYLLRGASGRTPIGEGVLLVGDAAGLARDCSGEGIRPAIESGLAAADALIAARGCYSREVLAAYRTRLEGRLGAVRSGVSPARFLPPGVRAPLGRALLASRWFTRRFLLSGWLAS